MPWPPPFMPNFGLMIDTLRTSVYLYAWALLTCTLRFALYYSIISKRLYILRLTISRATYRLAPTLVLLLASLVAFAVGGNQLYFTTTAEWSSPSASIGTTLYLLRRPMGMNWDRMAQSAMIWPLDSDEPSPVTIVFLMSFTCVTIWIMANLYRAVIIQEYATVVTLYQNKEPGDLTSDPWPTFNPLEFYRDFQSQRKEKAHKAAIRRAQQREWSVGRAQQIKKQQQLLKEQAEKATKKKGDPKGGSASPKKGHSSTPQKGRA